MFCDFSDDGINQSLQAKGKPLSKKPNLECLCVQEQGNRAAFLCTSMCCTLMCTLPLHNLHVTDALPAHVPAGVGLNGSFDSQREGGKTSCGAAIQVLKIWKSGNLEIWSRRACDQICPPSAGQIT